MDRGVKIALAALVFLIGTSFAFLYRRPLPDRSGYNSDKSSQLVLRGPRWNDPQQRIKRRLAPAKRQSTLAGSKSELPSIKPTPAITGHDGRVGHATASSAGASTQMSAPQKTTVLSPINTGQPPPRLAKVFPRHENSDDSRWGSAIGPWLPGSDKPLTVRPRTHTIIDGDTLEDLAKRYLGDPARAREIFTANRHLLLGPNVLPIGVELAIPSEESPPANPGRLLPDKPVVPVAAAN